MWRPFHPTFLDLHIDSEKGIPHSEGLLLASKIFSTNENAKPAMVIIFPVPLPTALGTANRKGVKGHVTSSDIGWNKTQWADHVLCWCYYLPNWESSTLWQAVSPPEKKWLMKEKSSKVIHGGGCWESRIRASRANNMIYRQEAVRPNSLLYSIFQGSPTTPPLHTQR